MNREGIQNRKKLEWAVKQTVFLGVLVILVLLLFLEATIFIFPTLRFYKREMLHTGNTATALLGRDYVIDVFNRTREIYYSTPEEIRSDQFSDEYKQRILAIVDDEFREKRNLLSLCREEGDYDDVCFAFFDEQMERLVFVFDGNDKTKAFLPGQWISNDNGMIESLSTITRTTRSEWFMPISYGKATGWMATYYSDFYDDNGNLLGYITMNVEVNSVMRQMRIFMTFYSPVMALITVWAARSMARWISRRLLRPIAELTDKAREYNSGGENSQKGDYAAIFKSMSLDTGDEMQELWETMVDMEEAVAAAMKKVREEAASKERIQTELDLARNIQMGALPVNFEDFSENREFKIYASMTPAKEVGGDFYDFFSIDDCHVGLVIADVSGKGVPASLFMMISKAFIRNRALYGGTPSEVLRGVNSSLCEDNPNTMFITAWFGILDTRTGQVTAANAGHEYPFIIDENGRPSKFEDPHGVVMGCLEGMEYEDYTFTVPRGGTLFVYTDGVAESLNESDEQFGLDRIGEALSKYAAEDPRGLVESIRQELDSFKGSMEQFDDITMLAVKYNG